MQFRPRGFQMLPTVIKNLVIINGLVWLAQVTVGKEIPLEDLFAMHYYQSELFKPWQFITYMFLHDSHGPLHILFNMFALWMFGSVLENLWGMKRFLIFYLACGIGAGIVQMGALWFDIHQVTTSDDYFRVMYSATLGASGAVMGIFAAFAYSFPSSELFIFPIPIPIKAKWAFAGYLAYDIISGLASPGSGVAHFAHVGGALIGILFMIIWNKSNRRTFY